MEATASNLAALFAAEAARHPGRLAIVDGSGSSERSISYGRLAGRVQGFAAGLAAMGVQRGQSVLLFVPPSIDLYVALLGCFHLGAVAVFIETAAGRRRIDAAIERARPRAVIAVPRAHLLKLVSPALRRVPIQIMAGGDWFPLERHERPALAQAPAEVRSDEPALVTFGTDGAGRPGHTARSHGYLMAQHEALNRELGVTGDDVDLSGAPRFVLNDLAVGATAVLPATDPRQPAQTDPEEVFEQIERHRATLASGSPAFFDRLCQWCARHGKRLPLRGIHTDGAPLAPTLARILADTVTGRVVVLYGASEVEPIAAIEARAMLSAMVVRDGNGHPPDGVCAGLPAPALRVRLVRPDDGPLALGEGGWSGLEVKAGEVGEIVVAGPYVPGPEPPAATPAPPTTADAARADAASGNGGPATGAPTGNGGSATENGGPGTQAPGTETAATDAGVIRDGDTVWRRTGDAGRFDAEGRLWLMGRVARRVRRENRVWWPIPAEVRALKVAGVRHAAYLGMPDPRYGEKAVLCVETTGVDLLPVERERLRVALAPMPVDEVHAMRRIPRDERHESRTDVDALARMIGEARPAVM